MRRFKQQLSLEETERILQTGKYCVMAVSGDDDYPYAVPVNYVYDGASVLQLIPKTMRPGFASDPENRCILPDGAKRKTLEIK